MTRRILVIGGGIIGLAVADQLARRPGTQVVVCEKESRWGIHQTGRNSGVIHSGLYYAPGSHKALMCRRGAESMTEFARANGVAVEVTGKLVVAVDDTELPRLAALRERGLANGLTVREIGPDEAAAFEPHLRCVRALHVPSTGIVDFAGVCAALVRRLEEAGADLRLNSAVTGLRNFQLATVVETTRGDVEAHAVVNCAGLYSDRVARLAGVRPGARIVPFRGEYYELTPSARHLVRGLIYPVPDPAFPFLGVHLTRGIDGSVHAGPNAVLALAREGYRWRTVRLRDLADTLRYAGFWRLAGRHYRSGAEEMLRSVSRRRFADNLRRMVPDIADDDLVRAEPGVRAQAISADGRLVDDFLIQRDGRTVHVLNAPSPAATSALEIAAHVASLVQ
ncbi:MAG TPA: L-2-hydroxyglutarate oxidase [Jiangellaceae bacterium]|nr:L-2-hydroxyglutarate oxidase [Jiangellaceae bacterium]